MMQREIDNMEIRSEEVQEILGTPPSFLMRWGSTLALIFFVVLAFLSFWIQYPDVVKGEIRISFTEPPRRMVAPQTGYMEEILVGNNEEVVAGQSMVVFRSNSNFRHILHLQDLIMAVPPNETDSVLLRFNPPRNLQLGEMQEDFFDFLEKQSQYQRRNAQYNDQRGVESLERQIGQLSKSINLDRRRIDLITSRIEKLNTERIQVERAVRSNEASYADVQRIEDRVNQLRQELQQTENSIQGKQTDISLLKNRISDVETGATETQNVASIELKDSFLKLRLRVNQWVKNYVVQAPVDGIVQITGQNVGEQQFVNKDDELMTVVPVHNRELLGRAKLEFNGSGKVREGQRALIKLQSHPFQEYGAVEGLVSFKSKVPDQRNNIPIEVIFPNQLLTNTGKQIDPEEELIGTVEIITNDKRFIERVIDLLPNKRSFYQ